AGGYVTAPAGSGHCTYDSGSLTGLTLPTLGRFAWTYQSYRFPSGSARGRRQLNRGVATRTLLDANGGTIRQWSHSTSLTPRPPPPPPGELGNTGAHPPRHRRPRHLPGCSSHRHTRSRRLSHD